MRMVLLNDAGGRGDTIGVSVIGVEEGRVLSEALVEIDDESSMPSTMRTEIIER